MKLSHYSGGIFLVAGTTIGAGMLGIPVSSGFMGFIPSMVVFLLFWAFFLVTAIFLIDVNDSIPFESNLTTMAGETLGAVGKVVTWVLYLLLLYLLTAAYIAGSAPLFQSAIYGLTGAELPLNFCYFGLPLVFGFFIYLGTGGVDFVNRLFMLGLFILYVLLIAFVPPKIDFALLQHVDLKAALVGVPVILISFGYHIILPTLATYLNHDRKRLILCAVLGSLITLGVYIIWQFLVLGVVPIKGELSLTQTWVEGNSAAGPLAQILQNPFFRFAAKGFGFFAIVTSFLGVSLSLADFVTDGFRLKKTWEGRLIACLLTFVPPILFVFISERGFLAALDYAGAFVALLLGFLPAAMAWQLKERPFYRSWVGRSLIILIALISISVVIIDVMIQRDFFASILERYKG